jgi:hypothetical protein
MRIGQGVTVVAVAAALAAGCGGGDGGEGGNGGGERPQQLDPARLAADWWRWVATRPEEEDSVTDPDGARCMQDQPDHVTFLAGTYGGDARRRCSIPAERPVFFPVLNRTCPATRAARDKAVEECADGLRGQARMKVTLDGRAITPRWVASPVFDLDPDPGAAVAGDAGERLACGYHVLIPALDPGQHELRFSGRDATGFELDVRYELRVGDSTGSV